jgi:hypothetical protein
MLDHVGDRPADGLLVKLGDFPADGGGPIASATRQELVEKFGDPVWAFVQDHSAGHAEDGLEAFLPTFFMRQKPFEIEAVARQSRQYKGGDKRRCSRETFDLHIGLNASPHQQETGVGDARGSRIRAQGEVHAGL